MYPIAALKNVVSLSNVLGQTTAVTFARINTGWVVGCSWCIYRLTRSSEICRNLDDDDDTTEERKQRER